MGTIRAWQEAFDGLELFELQRIESAIEVLMAYPMIEAAFPALETIGLIVETTRVRKGLVEGGAK